MGEEGPRCGAVQGSEDGPQNYDMLTDVFNSHWEKKPMGVRVAVSEQLEMDINGVAFLDDCKMTGLGLRVMGRQPQPSPRSGTRSRGRWGG